MLLLETFHKVQVTQKRVVSESYGLNCVPFNIYIVETSTSNVTVFGERALF